MPVMSKRLVLLIFATFATGFALAIWAEDVILRRHEDQLRFTAPKIHFVGGHTMDRLKEGNAVPIDFQATIAAGARSNVVERLVERFVVSYDLWEESFQVRRLGQRKSVSNLTAAQAEAWCFDNLGIPTNNIPRNQPLYFRLEIRADDSAARVPLFGPSDNFNLAALVNLFSRPAEREQPHWTKEFGPFGYSDIKESM